MSSYEFCPATQLAPTIKSCELPSGGSGEIEYIWLKNEVDCQSPVGTVVQMLANPDAYNWKIIPNSNTPEHNPGLVSKSTCFLRCSRRKNCDPYQGEANIVRIQINPDCGGEVKDKTCNDVLVSNGDGQITLNELPSGAKVEIIGPLLEEEGLKIFQQFPFKSKKRKHEEYQKQKKTDHNL